MSAKIISERGRFRTDFVGLPLSVKVAITIILASLSIILIATVLQVPIKKILPAFLVDSIKAFPFKSSTQTPDQLFLPGDGKDDPLRGYFYKEITGNAGDTEPDPEIQDGATRISIKVDQYPFFADEFDHNYYEYP